METRSIRLRTLALIATSAALVASDASMVEAASWRAFKALKFYVFDEIDDQAVVYASKGHFLVDPGDSEFVYLVNAKTRMVHRATEASAVGDDGPHAAPGDESVWSMLDALVKNGPALVWEDDAGRYSLSAKPPLLGETTLENLRKYTDKYDFDAGEYEPDFETVEAIQAVSQPTEIVVGFGLWCSICAEWLPRFMKTIEAAGNEHLTVRYLSINEDLDRPGDLLDEFAIDQVPTFAVRRGDGELGRIDPDRLDMEDDPVMEKMLLDLLTGR